LELTPPVIASMLKGGLPVGQGPKSTPEVMSEEVGVLGTVVSFDHGVISVWVIASPQVGGLIRKALWPALKTISRLE